MYKEIIKPKEEYYNLHIPKEYLNKEIEIVVKPKRDKQQRFKKISKITSGILSNYNIDPVKWQKEIRREWDER